MRGLVCLCGMLARPGLGSVVPASEGSSVSSPMARKVARAQPASRVYIYKYFDVAFNDGTKSGEGRMLLFLGFLVFMRSLIFV